MSRPEIALHLWFSVTLFQDETIRQPKKQTLKSAFFIYTSEIQFYFTSSKSTSCTSSPSFAVSSEAPAPASPAGAPC